MIFSSSKIRIACKKMSPVTSKLSQLWQFLYSKVKWNLNFNKFWNLEISLNFRDRSPNCCIWALNLSNNNTSFYLLFIYNPLLYFITEQSGSLWITWEIFPIINCFSLDCKFLKNILLISTCFSISSLKISSKWILLYCLLHIAWYLSPLYHNHWFLRGVFGIPPSHPQNLYPLSVRVNWLFF